MKWSFEMKYLPRPIICLSLVFLIARFVESEQDSIVFSFAQDIKCNNADELKQIMISCWMMTLSIGSKNASYVLNALELLPVLVASIVQLHTTNGGTRSDFLLDMASALEPSLRYAVMAQKDGSDIAYEIQAAVAFAIQKILKLASFSEEKMASSTSEFPLLCIALPGQHGRTSSVGGGAGNTEAEVWHQRCQGYMLCYQNIWEMLLNSASPKSKVHAVSLAYQLLWHALADSEHTSSATESLSLSVSENPSSAVPLNSELRDCNHEIKTTFGLIRDGELSTQKNAVLLYSLVLDAEFDPNQYLVRILGGLSCQEASLKCMTSLFDAELEEGHAVNGVINAICCMACPRSRNTACINKMDAKFHTNAKSVFRWALVSLLKHWTEDRVGSSERCFGQARRLCDFHNQRILKACRGVAGTIIPILIKSDKLKEFLMEVGDNETGIGSKQKEGWFDSVLPTAVPHLVIQQDTETLSVLAQSYHKIELFTHKILEEPGYDPTKSIRHLGPLFDHFMDEIGSEVLLEESRCESGGDVSGSDRKRSRKGRRLSDYVAEAFTKDGKKVTFGEVVLDNEQPVLNKIVWELSGKEKDIAKRAIWKFVELTEGLTSGSGLLQSRPKTQNRDEAVKSKLGSRFFSIIHFLENQKNGERKLETLRQIFTLVGTVKTTPFVPKIISLIRKFLHQKNHKPMLFSLASEVFLELVQMLDSEVLGKHISAIVVCILQFICPNDSKAFQPPESAKAEAMKILSYLLIDQQRSLRKYFDSIPFVFHGVCSLPSDLSDVICTEMKKVQLQDRLRKLDELMGHESVGVRLFSLRQLSVILETSNPHTPVNDASSFTLFFETNGTEPELALPLTLEATGDLVKSWISGGEYVLPELSSIIQTLLKVSGSAQSSQEIQTLCARCLGIIGAMDPSRLNLQTVGKHRKEMTMVELAFHLIKEYLVPELGSDAGTQDRMAFAIQEVLQFLMDDMNDTHGASSNDNANSSNARRKNDKLHTQEKLQAKLEKLGLLEFVEPYFITSYGFQIPQLDDSGEKVESLFTDPSVKLDKFSDWVGAWVTRLTSMCLAFENFEGKRLFEGMAVVTANTKQVHEKIALLLLPYLIKTALEHGSRQHFDTIQAEILAVLGEKDDIEFGHRRFSSRSKRRRSSSSRSSGAGNITAISSQAIFTLLDQLKEWVHAETKGREHSKRGSKFAVPQSARVLQEFILSIPAKSLVNPATSPPPPCPLFPSPPVFSFSCFSFDLSFVPSLLLPPRLYSSLNFQILPSLL
jgi:hypothetical protein